MNIEYLKYFAELAKIQHYGKAAQALNISQKRRLYGSALYIRWHRERFRECCGNLEQLFHLSFTTD